MGCGAFRGSGQAQVSPCVGMCQSWHNQDLVVTLPSRLGWRDEPEDATGSGAMQACPKSWSKGGARGVSGPWDALAPTGAGFCHDAAWRGCKKTGDDASPHGGSRPGDSWFGWGTGRAVVFGCQIGWRSLAGGSGKRRLCQPLGLTGVQPAPLTLWHTRAHRSRGSGGGRLCQEGRLRHST